MPLSLFLKSMKSSQMVLLFFLFETGCPYVALNSQRSRLSLSSTGINGMHHHTCL